MTNLRKFQIAGVAGIVLTYILFVLAAQGKISVWYGWGVAVAIGIIELITIFGYRANITRFWRNMYGKRADRVFLFALLPITWWLAGELAAGFLLIGWIWSHIHEHD